MQKIMKLLISFIAVLFLVACGSSSSSTDPINPDLAFTTEMVSGKTIYTSDIEEGTKIWYRVIFLENGSLYVVGPNEDGVSGDWSVVDGAIVGTDNGEDYRMTLVSSTDTTWTVNDGSETMVTYLQQKFTEEMLVGNTYEINDPDEGIVQLTFNSNHTVTIIIGGVTDSTTYEIDANGVLIADDNGMPDIHYLIYEEDNGNIFEWNEDEPSTWVLQQ